MNSYRVTLNGSTPLILHNDDVEWSDELKAWRDAPENRELSVAGDDRSPAWTYQGYFYWNDDGVAIMPAANILASLAKAGAKVRLKGSETFKCHTQSGLLFEDMEWELLASGKTISRGDLPEIDNLEFVDHATAAREGGYRLFVKRATVGQAKHVRVRPRLDAWQVNGTITVLDPDLFKHTKRENTLLRILEIAGLQIGLGDWRPSAPKKPGPFGKFTVELERT